LSSPTAAAEPRPVPATTSHDAGRPIGEGPTPERLSGEPVVDAHGLAAEPGDALPFPSHRAPPGMLTDRELSYLHWLASNAEGRGRSVELGCFLGGSTAALVAGLRRAGLCRGGAHDRLIVYDAFEIPSDDGIADAWWMERFGLSAGERFRGKYEQLHADRLDAIDIREGWLPEDIDPERERALYPEQAPIELLFVDVAKTWGVSRTVHTAFVPHVRAGGVLVQQDFCEAMCPWLPVHMWMLRDAFEPLDMIRGGCTVSFRRLDSADTPTDAIRSWRPTAENHRATWDAVQAYWRERVGAPRAGFLLGHRAVAAASVGDADDAIRSARAFEGWRRSSSARGLYPAPMWRDALDAIAARFRSLGQQAAAHAAASIAAEHAAHETLERIGRNAETMCTRREPDEFRRIWRDVAQRLAERGLERVALFGAGRHARAVLGAFWPTDAPRPVCLLDDDPTASEIEGVPVRSTRETTAEALAEEIDAVVVCSDAHEPAITRSARGFFAGFDRPILGVYAREEERPIPAQPDRPPDEPRSARLHRPRPEHLDAHAESRRTLGLNPARNWVATLAETFAAPDWARGYINHHDTLLLWDLVEAVRPDFVVEIGAASGVSTASLAAAVRHFRPDAAGPLVHTFDLAERCYFDPRRPVAAAVEEIAPDLAGRVRVHTRCTASSAASCFAPGQIPLLLIDGDHRHPGPTLDLLALLYALKPGAWVALHDIELTAVERSVGHSPVGPGPGAERLFRRWPFEKCQPRYDNPLLNNIGAIRLPGDAREAVPVLLDLLREDWESEGPKTDLAGALAHADPR